MENQSTNQIYLNVSPSSISEKKKQELEKLFGTEEKIGYVIVTDCNQWLATSSGLETLGDLIDTLSDLRDNYPDVGELIVYRTLGKSVDV